MDFKKNFMKKIFILLLIIPILGFSQNDLVFNQVLIVELAFNVEQIVPEGKVWKIQSVDGTPSISVNGSEWAIGTVGNFRNMPVWFPAGTILKQEVTSSNSTYLSTLEFNVVAASSSSGSGSSSGSSGSGFSSSTPGDDFTDQSGNSFNSTNTGDLTWSTSNASNTTYRDGTPIPQITNEVDWNTATTGAWCYLHFDESNASYGKLYNWYAVVGANDADPNTIPKIFGPSGWHVPSFAEWNNLMATNTDVAPLMSGNEISHWQDIGLGGKMKSQTEWNLGFNGTNSTGLNIKPYSSMEYGNDTPLSEGWVDFSAGYEYYDVGSMTVFWSKDKKGANYAYSMGFGYEPGPPNYVNTQGWSNDRVYSWRGYVSDGSSGGLYAAAPALGVNSAFYVRLVKDY